MGFRKPRSDSKLKNLDPKKADKIVGWLLGGMSYSKALELLEKEPFYIETSERALSEFYQDYCLPVLLQRNQRSRDLANSFYTEAKKHPAHFAEATIEELGRLCFELARAGQANGDFELKGVKSVMGLLLKHHSQEERRAAREFSREKWKATQLKKIDLGMEELYAQIKDNPKALAAFKTMREAISKK
jgi:hypothetical protein